MIRDLFLEGNLLDFYILCSESLVELDRLKVEVELRSRLFNWVKSKSKTLTTIQRSRWFDQLKPKLNTLTTSRRGQPTRGPHVGVWHPTED
jgi:hypothetical protein